MFEKAIALIVVLTYSTAAQLPIRAAQHPIRYEERYGRPPWYHQAQAAQHPIRYEERYGRPPWYRQAQAEDLVVDECEAVGESTIGEALPIVLKNLNSMFPNAMKKFPTDVAVDVINCDLVYRGMTCTLIAVWKSEDYSDLILCKKEDNTICHYVDMYKNPADCKASGDLSFQLPLPVYVDGSFGLISLKGSLPYHGASACLTFDVLGESC